MWHYTLPSENYLRDVHGRLAGQDFSYAAVGASNGDAPAGFDLDHNRVLLGHGQAAYAAACGLLRTWRQFPAGWTRIWPGDTPIEAGRNLLMLARFGVWWLNTCRIVYVLDEGLPRRFGFAYGTLPGHVECGEERFCVEWRPDDSVWYDIRAVSRPSYWMVRLGYPLARRLQRRFVRGSLEQMRRLVLAETSQ